MTHYFVVSPTMSYVVPILDDGTGPIEEGACVVSVEARTKRDARKLAVKHPDMADWVDMARGDDQNPFSGLDVWDAECSHGVCMCDMCRGECQQCYDEAMKESDA